MQPKKFAQFTLSLHLRRKLHPGVCPPYETIDLIIAIQSSGYAEEEYSIVKTFLVDFIKEMVQLTSSDTRVKLLSFQEKPDPFGRSPKIGFKSPYAVIEKVEELKMSKGKGSSWFWTLNLIQKMVFAPNFGNREDAKDFIVLIVNDLPTDDSLYDATIPARQLRDEGVKIIVIGILPHDSTTTRELFISKLFQITGSRDKIIIADGGAESFNDKLPSLPQALCGQPCSD
uniref:Uncharacterized protein LOC100186206 n=1 Tax=Phallusia mammillata TaxID=59560 RepID=A0A6F9DIM0_9ASCI|nr:uncharacterized protein LOC100186206 [Phallusia mammillata]